MRPLNASLLVLCTLMSFGSAAGQEPDQGETPPVPRWCDVIPNEAPTGLATGLDDMARMLEIQTTPRPSRIVRRHSETVWGRACPGGGDPPPVPDSARLPVRVSVLPIYSRLSYRTGYPDDRNNGALWEGRGLSQRIQGGVHLSAPYVSVGLVPEIVYQQNVGYDFPRRLSEGFSQYIYPHYTTQIDLPHRQGPGAFGSVEPGQSYIRVDGYGVAAGFSTENLWWGPATRYPLLMSNTAPGMPHYFLGTSGPTDIWLGLLDAELVWARSTESDYFDEVPENDVHMMGGLVLAFSPRPLPGLWLGFGRVYHYADDGWGDLGELVTATGIGGYPDEGNDIASVFARWVFPEAGAEVYGEWAREDRSNDIHELIQEPDHSQAYMLGFQKVTELPWPFALRVQGELVSLQELPELRTGSRPLPVMYTHASVVQGHTHRGQLLGAGIGLGADAQFLAFDLLDDRGRAGLYFERVRRGDFAVAALELRKLAPYEHDAEITAGVRALALHRDFTLAGRLAYSYRYNRDFGDDDVNWTLALEGSWYPRLTLVSP